MSTTSELDELAARVAKDPSLPGTGLDHVLISVIQRTRRHWIAMLDPGANPLPREEGLPPPPPQEENGRLRFGG